MPPSSSFCNVRVHADVDVVVNVRVGVDVEVGVDMAVGVGMDLGDVTSACRYWQSNQGVRGLNITCLWLKARLHEQFQGSNFALD